jgi:hypothetical protein
MITPIDANRIDEVVAKLKEARALLEEIEGDASFERDCITYGGRGFDKMDDPDADLGSLFEIRETIKTAINDLCGYGSSATPLPVDPADAEPF